MTEHKYPVPGLTPRGEKLKENALIAYDREAFELRNGLAKVAYDREIFELRNRLAKVLATIWENHQAKGKDDD